MPGIEELRINQPDLALTFTELTVKADCPAGPRALVISDLSPSFLIGHALFLPHVL